MGTIGGMETHVVNIASAMAGAGWSVTLLTTSNSLGAAARSRIKNAGVEFFELQSPRFRASRLHRLAWLIFKTLALRRRACDVIYTNGQGALARIVWLAARAGTRVVHHHHTAGDETEQRTTWTPGFERLLKAAPELVACAEYCRAALSKRLRRSDIRVLPYLTDEVRIQSVERAPNPPETLRFGFVGRLERSKGIDVILQLSQDPGLKNIEWHLHGAGTDYMAQNCAENSRVVYHAPYQGAEALARILQELDALVLFSSQNEGCPLALIEAMAAGLPWIATDRGGVRELAKSSENCRVLSSSPTYDEIKSGVAELATAIRGGRTSPVCQRKTYDDCFAPALVFARWLALFTAREAEPPRPRGVDLGFDRSACG
jgi:glycosyltransferase involved in cell wall biosynthesis